MFQSLTTHVQQQPEATNLDLQLSLLSPLHGYGIIFLAMLMIRPFAEEWGNPLFTFCPQLLPSGIILVWLAAGYFDSQSQPAGRDAAIVYFKEASIVTNRNASLGGTRI
jgi:hypothetical protein